MNILLRKLLRYLERVRNVNQFTCNTDAVATVFVHIDTDFWRISTTVPNYDGKPAVGTVLDQSSAAYKALIKCKSFVGNAVLFGTEYYSIYVPYFQDNELGVVIALYVGIPLVQGCKCDFKKCRCGRKDC